VTPTDPLRVRDQPALWTATRRRWLVPAGILAIVAIAMLAATLSLQVAVPVLGIAAVIVLYIVMILCGMLVRDAHRRNLAFAWLMSAIAVVAVVALIAVVLGQWR